MKASLMTGRDIMKKMQIPVMIPILRLMIPVRDIPMVPEDKLN